MLRISKSIKKIALSLLVVGLAIGTQAHKSADSKLAEGDIYVNLSGDSYTFLDPNEYDAELCISSNEIQCAYRVTLAGEDNVITGFDADQAVDYLAEEWIEPASESTGLYVPEQ